MYLFNLSIIFEDSVQESLIPFIKQVAHAYTDKELKLLKMLHSPHPGQTYCLQIIAKSEEEVNQLKADIMQELQTYISNNCAEKAFIFDSLMQYLPTN